MPRDFSVSNKLKWVSVCSYLISQTFKISSCPYERSNDYEISSTACSPSYTSLDYLNRSWTLDSSESDDIFDYDFEGIFEEISNDSSHGLSLFYS